MPRQPRRKKRPGRACNYCRRRHPGKPCPMLAAQIAADHARTAQMTPGERYADLERRVGPEFAALVAASMERRSLKPHPLADLDKRAEQIPLFERD